MINGKNPTTIKEDEIKVKARHSASTLKSLMFNGYRGLKYLADFELVAYYVGVRLVALAVAKDMEDAAKLNFVINPQPSKFMTPVRFDIENEIKTILNNNAKT